MARALGLPQRLALIAWLCAPACAHGPRAPGSVVLDAAEAASLPRFEDRQQLGDYLRWLHRARAHRSTPRVDLATRYWFGASPRREGADGAADPTPAPSDGAGHDTPSPVKLSGGHLRTIRCGVLDTVDLPGGRTLGTPPSTGVQWDALLGHGETLVALGGPGPRRGRYRRRDRDLEIITTFAADDGRLAALDSIELRAGGWAAARGGQASIVGDELVLVRRLRLDRGAGSSRLPAVRRRGETAWTPLLVAADIARPVLHGDVLHVVVRCDLADLGRSCRASGVLGEFALSHAQRDATYLWMIEGATGPERPQPRHAILRLPSDGSAITALRVPGMPLGPGAWRVREDGSIDAVIAVPRAPRNVFAPEITLLHVDADRFARGLATAAAGTRLPGAHLDENTPLGFVGDRLVYADRPRGDCRGPTRLHVRDLDAGSTTPLTVPGCIDVVHAGATSALLADWTTIDGRTRLWPLAAAPTPTLGDSLELAGAYPPYLGPLGSASPAGGSEALWIISTLHRPLGTPPTTHVFAQHEAGLTERAVVTRTIVGERGAPGCDGVFTPPRAFWLGDRIFAAYHDALIELAPSGATRCGGRACAAP